MGKKINKTSKVDSIIENQPLSLMNEYSTIVNRAFNLVVNNDRKVFLTSNIVGDYAEYLVAEALNLSRKNPSFPYVDAIGNSDKKTYQIKSRWMNGNLSSSKKEFGIIPLIVNCKKTETKNIEDVIDYLILVVFKNTTFNDPIAYMVEVRRIGELLSPIKTNDVSKAIMTIVTKGGKKYYKIKYDEMAFEQACKDKKMKKLKL